MLHVPCRSLFNLILLSEAFWQFLTNETHFSTSPSTILLFCRTMSGMSNVQWCKSLSLFSIYCCLALYCFKLICLFSLFYVSFAGFYTKVSPRVSLNFNITRKLMVTIENVPMHRLTPDVERKVWGKKVRLRYTLYIGSYDALVLMHHRDMKS